jgi:GMP synthase (glutamine-hydrolysing)
MKYRLLQAREPGDPVRKDERNSFAMRMGVDLEDILPWDLLARTPDYASVTEGVDAVLVGGSGAFSVYNDEPWIAPFVETMGELAGRQFPTLAACFGFQAMVVALGGDVRRDQAGAEVGTSRLHCLDEVQEDPLFSRLPLSFLAQQGHKDRAVTLPEGVTNYIASERCPFQGIRVGDGLVYAVQFHPELTGEENRSRFERYYDSYVYALGSDRTQEIQNSFGPSPEANDLLTGFKTLLESTK